MLFSVIEKIGPVWICLHEAELEELSKEEAEDVRADLGIGRGKEQVQPAWNSMDRDRRGLLAPPSHKWSPCSSLSHSHAARL